MMQVPDAASVATILWLEKLTGKKAGASTGTNIWGALCLAQEMEANNQQGSIVTLMCDSGERYLDSYYDKNWVKEHIGDIQPYTDKLNYWMT